MVYNSFDKKATGRTVNNEILSNKELTKELCIPIIKNFQKPKVHSPFIDNI